MQTINHLVFIVVIIILFFSVMTCFGFNKKTLRTNFENKSNAGEMCESYENKPTTFQHNPNIKITKKSLRYTQEYKKQLLSCISKLLFDLDIKFTISHGNLLEHIRGKLIQHDDDIDIRFNIGDFDKWIKFCNSCQSSSLQKYNLYFDDRFHDAKTQIHNGIQCRLIRFNKQRRMKTFKKMDIHCDLVCNIVHHPLWNVYDIDFSKVQKVFYLGVETSTPSHDDSVYILKKQYGENYLTPDKQDAIDFS